MELNKPEGKILLIHPSYSSNYLSNQAIALTTELTSYLVDFSFEDASGREIKSIIKICKVGVERITGLAGSVNYLSADVINAEQTLNAAIEDLTGALNSAYLELSKRALTDGQVVQYLEALSDLIGTSLSWSAGKAEEPEKAPPEVIDEEIEKWL